jgi:hypothetical protein
MYIVIFVNMFTFDKTNATHRKAVQNIFDNLFEAGKKRGYSKYRSHVNTMGKHWFSRGMTACLQPLILIQIGSLRCTISMTMRIEDLLRQSKTLLILMVYCRQESKVFGQSDSEMMRFRRRIYELGCP